jgi:hypothetical protein
MYATTTTGDDELRKQYASLYVMINSVRISSARRNASIPTLLSARQRRRRWRRRRRRRDEDDENIYS